MPQSDNSGGPNENNVGTNHILLTQKIVKKKKSCENSMSLALLESRKRVEYLKKSTMHMWTRRSFELDHGLPLNPEKHILPNLI